MPLYDYLCDQCGLFRTWQTISKSGAPTRCPECGVLAPRTIASPYVEGGAAAMRYKAEARNEKSAHKPTVVRHLKVGQKGLDHRHGPHGHGHNPTAKRGHHRPWMVGH